MGVLSRMSVVIRAKMNRIIDDAEDPNETLDYSFERQLEMLRDVKRGVVEMVAAKRQIQQQASKLQQNVNRLDMQARRALEAGREDVARIALQRKQAAVLELQGLDEQIAGMEVEQEKLTQAEQRLQAKVAAFRYKKEIVKAQYNAAQAQVRIGESLGGISEEMSDVGLAIERAEMKADKMRARAGAIDELVAVGVLDDGLSGNDISRDLDHMIAGPSVDVELELLKSEMTGVRGGHLPEPPRRGLPSVEIVETNVTNVEINETNVTNVTNIETTDARGRQRPAPQRRQLPEAPRTQPPAPLQRRQPPETLR